jgi:hypothetical protein
MGVRRANNIVYNDRGTSIDRHIFAVDGGDDVVVGDRVERISYFYCNCVTSVIIIIVPI